MTVHKLSRRTSNSINTSLFKRWPYFDTESTERHRCLDMYSREHSMHTLTHTHTHNVSPKMHVPRSLCERVLLAEAITSITRLRELSTLTVHSSRGLFIRSWSTSLGERVCREPGYSSTVTSKFAVILGGGKVTCLCMIYTVPSLLYLNSPSPSFPFPSPFLHFTSLLPSFPSLHPLTSLSSSLPLPSLPILPL